MVSLATTSSICRRSVEHIFGEKIGVTNSHEKRGWYHPLFLWTWWDSNPRPHKETMCFLHAYLGIYFRAVARPEPPTTALSPKNFTSWTEKPQGYFRLFCAAEPEQFGTTSSERRPVPSPCKEIKPSNLLYFG